MDISSDVQDSVARLRARACAVVVCRTAEKLTLCQVANRPTTRASLESFLRRQVRCQDGLRAYCLRPADLVPHLHQAGALDSEGMPDLRLTDASLAACPCACPEECLPIDAFPEEVQRVQARTRHLTWRKKSAGEVVRWLQSQSYVSIETPAEGIIAGLVESGVIRMGDDGRVFYGEAQAEWQGLSDEGTEQMEQMERVFGFAPTRRRASTSTAPAPPVPQSTAGHCDNFDDMGLEVPLLRGIYAYGLEKPSAVQCYIPYMMRGSSLVARAESGTGKTVAFAVGVLHVIDQEQRGCRAIVLASGREQALQTHKVFTNLADYMQGIHCHCSIGGTSVREDSMQLRQGSQVVVGTTGRIQDSITKGHLRTGRVQVMVLDDFDALGSSPASKQAVHQIKGRLPRNVQIWCFSAYIPPEAQSFADRLTAGKDVVAVDVGRITPTAVHHFYVETSPESKLETICDLYEIMTIRQSVVFANTRRKVDWLGDSLTKRDYTVSALHAELDQRERDLVMREFRSGVARVLLTCDLFERGLDCQQVNLVLNFDFPNSAVSYLHKGGRTGRYGRKGAVINFVVAEEWPRLREVEALLRIQLKELPSDVQEYIDG